MGDKRILEVAGAWLITMAMFAPAWGEPGPLLALVSVRSLVDAPPRVSSQRSTPEILVPNHFEALTAESPAPAPRDPNLPQLRTSLYDKEPKDLRLIVTDGERPRLIEFKAAVTAVTWHPLTAKLSAFGQLPYVSTNVPDGTGTFDGISEPAALGIKGEVEGFEAGVQYRSVGKRLERLVGGPSSLKDREGYELWAAQRLGLFKLRISDSELTDNVDRNPALPRVTRDQNAVTAGLAVPEWPVLELTYAAGDSTRLRLTPQGRDGERERYDFDSLTGSAYYYGGPWWEVAASSTVAQSRHEVRVHDETMTTSQDLSLTLRLLDSFTAVPAVSLSQEHYLQSAVRSDTGTAGLTLSYAPPRSGWSVSTYGGYTSTRTSDSSIDGRSVSLTGALTYALGQWLPKRSTVSVECGYDRYVDGVVPQSSSSAISGFVLLRIAGF
jgi:hypothetical protein